MGDLVHVNAVVGGRLGEVTVPTLVTEARREIIATTIILRVLHRAASCSPYLLSGIACCC